MRKTWLLATALALSPALALGQTTEELNNDGKNPDNVVTQSMGLNRQSYSPLAQINKSNVKRLVPVWSTSLMNDTGELAAPVLYDGVIYAINSKWTFAIDVETRPADLAYAGSERTRQHARGQRHLSWRAGDLQRQALPRHRRQSPRRARNEDRQGAVESEIRRGEGRLSLERRPDRCQRGADLRHGRWQIDDAGFPRWLEPGYRRKAVAPLHNSGSGRARLGDVAGEQRRLEIRRRSDVALGLL